MKRKMCILYLKLNVYMLQLNNCWYWCSFVDVKKLYNKKKLVILIILITRWPYLSKTNNFVIFLKTKKEAREQSTLKKNYFFMFNAFS